MATAMDVINQLHLRLNLIESDLQALFDTPVDIVMTKEVPLKETN